MSVVFFTFRFTINTGRSHICARLYLYTGMYFIPKNRMIGVYCYVLSVWLLVHVPTFLKFFNRERLACYLERVFHYTENSAKGMRQITLNDRQFIVKVTQRRYKKVRQRLWTVLGRSLRGDKIHQTGVFRLNLRAQHSNFPQRLFQT